MAAVQAYDQEVSALLQQVDSDQVGLVQAADLLEGLFKKMGLLYEMQINSRQVFGVTAFGPLQYTVAIKYGVLTAGRSTRWSFTMPAARPPVQGPAAHAPPKARLPLAFRPPPRLSGFFRRRVVPQCSTVVGQDRQPDQITVAQWSGPADQYSSDRNGIVGLHAATSLRSFRLAYGDAPMAVGLADHEA